MENIKFKKHYLTGKDIKSLADMLGDEDRVYIQRDTARGYKMHDVTELEQERASINNEFVEYYLHVK